MRKKPGPKPKMTATDCIQMRYDQHKEPRRAKCGHLSFIISKSNGLCQECNLAELKKRQLKEH